MAFAKCSWRPHHSQECRGWFGISQASLWGHRAHVWVLYQQLLQATLPPQHPRCSGSALAARAPQNFMSHSQHPVPPPPHRSCQHPSNPPAGAPGWQPLLPCPSSHQHWQGRISADAESPRHPHRARLPQRHRCSTRSLTARKRHFYSAKQCANTGSKFQHCSGTETRAVKGFACLAQSWRSNF